MLGRWPYKWALQAVRWRLPDVEVWPRNSFLTNAFRPLRSDLDLTLWFAREPTPDVCAQVRRELARVKRVFPALGECNVYARDLTLAQAPFFNRYELARDPLLSERLGQISFFCPDPAARAAFLLRMLEADFKNLVTRPLSRSAKWRLHFLAVGRDAHLNQGDPLAGILGEAFADVAEGLAEPVAREIEKYLCGRILDKISEQNVEPNAVLAALFPHRFCFRADPMTELSARLSAVCDAQIAWEIMGMNSQFRLGRDRSGIDVHLERLSSRTDSPELHSAIRDFRSRLRTPNLQVVAHAPAPR